MEREGTFHKMLTVHGKTFEVRYWDRTDKPAKGRYYLLYGPRGACYGTMRYLKHPDMMFLVNARAGRMNVPRWLASFVWTDEGGDFRDSEKVWMR